MGQIAEKLKTRFAQWSGRLRQRIAQREAPHPVRKDARDLETLVAAGQDPFQALYLSAQGVVAWFTQSVAVLPELKPYFDILTAAEDNYLPGGPPMSPLTRSFFTAWASFDLRFGADQETIGTCLLDVSRSLDLDGTLVEAARHLQQSRMGIYEHCGTTDCKVQFRELMTGKELTCLCTSGYHGKTGELWYVRLCPPIFDLVDYHVTVTTPYILRATKTDWADYLKRTMLGLGAGGEPQRLYELLKYGLSTDYWNEFVFQAYHYCRYDAIVLAGIPDVKGSLPRAKRDEGDPSRQGMAV